MYANRRFDDNEVARMYREVCAETGGIKAAMQWVRDRFLNSEQLIKQHWQQNFSDLIEYAPKSPFFWSSMYYLMHMYNQGGKYEPVPMDSRHTNRELNDAWEMREELIRQERVAAQRRILERIWNNS